MSITRKATETQPQTLTFNVHRNVYWRGKRLKDGDVLCATQAESLVEPMAAWLTHGWVTDPRADKPVSLAPSKGPALVQQEGRFQIIQRDKITPSPFNPRKDFSSDAARAYLDELAASIRARGIIQPISVRPRPDTDPAEGRFEVIAGECRWRGAGIAGLAQVPCIVRDLDDVATIEVQTIENLQRRDINAMEEAEGYALLMRRGKYKIGDLIKKTGKSEASIYARLKLLDAPPGIRDAIAQERLKPSTGELVARLDPELRGAAMDAILFPEEGEGEDGGVLSFRQTKAWISMNQAKLEAEAAWQKTAKGHHLFKTASKVLTGEESGKIIFGGGWLHSEAQAIYVKPSDTCYEDPEHRSWEELAENTGHALPGPVLARDPHGNKVVVLYPKAAAIAAMGDAIPDPEEYKRRQAAREAAEKAEREERQRQQAAAAAARAAESQRAEQMAARLVEIARVPMPEAEVQERFLRFLVLSHFRRVIDFDEERLVEALRAQGVPVSEEEAQTVVEPAWLQDYLLGCDAGQLRGWLVYLALRPFDQEDAEEEMITLARDVFAVADDPQTSAVDVQAVEAAA